MNAQKKEGMMGRMRSQENEVMMAEGEIMIEDKDEEEGEEKEEEDDGDEEGEGE